MSFSVNGPAKETIAGASDPNAKIISEVKPEGEGQKKAMVSQQMLGGLLANQVGQCNAISVPLSPPMGNPIGGGQQGGTATAESKDSGEAKESGGMEVTCGTSEKKKIEKEKEELYKFGCNSDNAEKAYDMAVEKGWFDVATRIKDNQRNAFNTISSDSTSDVKAEEEKPEPAVATPKDPVMLDGPHPKGTMPPPMD